MGERLALAMRLVGSRPIDLSGGNLNDDAFPDVVVANMESGGISIMFGDGAGKFNEPFEIQVGLGSSPCSYRRYRCRWRQRYYCS